MREVLYKPDCRYSIVTADFVTATARIQRKAAECTQMSCDLPLPDLIGNIKQQYATYY